MELNVLCNAVMSACGEFRSIKLETVYERWKLVLDSIIEDNGGNRLIEAKRGKLYQEPSPGWKTSIKRQHVAGQTAPT